MGRRARCLHRLLFLGCLAWALAQTNVTVDDQLLSANTSAGFSLQYLPDDVWQQGNGCAACALHPSPSSMFQNTWHDTSTGSKLLARQIEVNFIGTAIYVFFTVPDLLNSPGLVPFTTNLTFTLDGEMVGQYSHQPEGTTDYLYNVPCYTNDSLSPGSHFLDVSVEPYNGSPSFALFDYLIYTCVWEVQGCYKTHLTTE
ncbi:hypothetical protein BC835DRAFT_1270856 [Cytidiella melzeri]|nr:hypothetical protein BC835DRAFT_1270856 [Cytidiella melzeri]